MIVRSRHLKLDDHSLCVSAFERITDILDQSEFLTAEQNSVYICMKYEYIPLPARIF